MFSSCFHWRSHRFDPHFIHLVDLLSKDEASGIETTCAQGRFSSTLDIYQIGGTK